MGLICGTFDLELRKLDVVDRVHDSQCSQTSAAASANIATTAAIPSDSAKSMTINGRTWILTPDIPDTAGDLQPAINLVEFSNDDIACVMHKDDLFKYKAYLCENGLSHVSIDWSMHTSPTDLSQVLAEPVIFTAT